MLRHCITFLRTRGLSLFLPLDQHIYFHKITGFFIFGYSILHTLMHLMNFSKSVPRPGGDTYFPFRTQIRLAERFFRVSPLAYRHHHHIRSKSKLRGIHGVRMALHHRPGNLRTRSRVRQPHGHDAHSYPVRDVRLFAAIRAPRRMF